MLLEEATREELIAELCGRETFRGVVIWQHAEFRGDDKVDLHGPWRHQSRKCVPAEVCRLLLDCAEDRHVTYLPGVDVADLPALANLAVFCPVCDWQGACDQATLVAGKSARCPKCDALVKKEG